MGSSVPASGFMVLRAPEVQLSKDFGEDQGGAAHRQSLESAHKAYLDTLSDNGIRAKKDDVLFLEKALDAERLYKEIAPQIKSRAKEILVKSKLPIFSQTEKDGIVLSGWKENTVASALYATILADVPVYCFRVVSLVEARDFATAAKAKAKKQLHEQADVEMADATKPGPSIQSMIDKAISARFKKAPSKGGAKKVSRHLRPSDYPSNSFTEYTQWQEGEEDDGNPVSQKGSDKRQTLSTQGRSKTAEGYEGSPQTQKGQGERQGQTVVPFRYGYTHTYPDWLLTIPLPRAIDYIILNTPVNILLASQFKNSIHRGPNVNLPVHIEQQLSVGMNYMFKRKRNSKLIKNAWLDFTERLRWRLFFSFTEPDKGSYDPDYEVPHTRKGKAPQLPQYLEYGITLGSVFVNNTIRKQPVDEGTDAYKSFSPKPHQIQEFLVTNNYVVTMTDKNLGIAVSERTWLSEKCLELLSDENNYTKIHPLTAIQKLDQKCTKMEIIASLAESFLPNGKQLGNYLRHLITPPKGKHNVPLFYGIPKIHKEPVKMRPIIPCHSAIQNPAAKYVSKILKPIIQSAPSIIHGTKDLAIKLSTLKLQHGRKYYIVTGDVVAFYPNIPIKKCIDIVCELYLQHYHNGVTPTDELKLHEADIFIQCLHIGNKELILKYEDTLYLQTRGLAMGVADSPDLANLFGWWFEDSCKVLSNPLIPFYGRYIDDVFALVYANSEEEALAHLQIVQFDDCRIEWNVSDQFQVFLDMTLFIDENNMLQYMPYRKQRSHQERIPWISHHPLDVKRGTFIGEMSRLATISSTHSIYCNAIKGLASLYIARGYPGDLVYKWTEKNILERWNKRLNDNKDKRDQVLVLKSEFNTTWDYFNASELGSTILEFWRDWLTHAEENNYSLRFPQYSADLADLSETQPDLCTRVTNQDGEHLLPDIRKLDILNRRMIVSRKRTRNLFDLTNLWKKLVLSKMDQQILPDNMDLSSQNIDEDVDMDIDSDDDDSSSARSDEDPFIQLLRAEGSFF
jgi:hypothetical protein